MDTTTDTNAARPVAAPVGTRLGQIAWVVPDIAAAERFFRQTLGVPGFAKMENLSARDLDGTYRGAPADFTFHLYMAHSGESLIELIQPLGGRSLFHEFLDAHPAGGVQHVAYMVPIADRDGAVARLTSRGYGVVQTLRLPVAEVAFFDTTAELGVATEIIGVTAAGDEFVAALKAGRF